MTEERNKDRKKVKGYDDGLQEKLPNIYETLHHENRVASGRMKTSYDLSENSIGFQAGDLVWLYNPRRRKGRCPNLSAYWEGAYTVMTMSTMSFTGFDKGRRQNEDCSVR